MKSILPLVLVSALFVLPDPTRAAVPHETAVVLSAADLVAPDLLAGPSHRVRDQVVTDGYRRRLPGGRLVGHRPA